MNVVWVTPQLPDPRFGGGAGHEFELLSRAAQRHDVHIITSAPAAFGSHRHLENIGISVERVAWHEEPPPPNPISTAWRLITDRTTIDFSRRLDRIRALTEALRQTEKNRKVDLVHINLGEIAPIASVARSASTLLLFDVYTRMMDRESANASSARHKLMWAVEKAKASRWETRWYRAAGSVACVSPVDADTVSAMTHRPVEVIRNPIAPSFFAPPRGRRSASMVALVANLAYRPNVDAVEWFVAEIWPGVIRQRPDARLSIVGRDPVPEILAAAAKTGVSLEVNVEDVRPYYWEAAVAVAPIRLGSGLRNKVLHAMACETPLVATTTAVEGIEVRHGEHLLIANEPIGFANAIVEVIGNPQEAARRAARARALANGHQADRVAESFEAWWERAAALRQ